MEELYKKFDEDVKKRSRVLRLLLAIDQFFNVLFWNGSQDETISSHVRRRIDDDKANKFEIWLCSVLRRFERNHCKKSLGE